MLGVHHMANPGRDILNVDADDVLAPKRQAEVAQLIETSKRFHPTKIAIEADVGSQRVVRECSDYLAGTYASTRNEIDQVGYRLEVHEAASTRRALEPRPTRSRRSRPDRSARPWMRRPAG